MSRALLTRLNARGRSIVTYVRPPVRGEVYLVGTAHLGRRSRQEVIDTLDPELDRVRPAAVVVELCQKRAAKLAAQEVQRRDDAQTGSQPWDRLLETLLERLLGLRASSDSLGILRRVRSAISQAVGVATDYGGDMAVAVRRAESLDARVVLGDADVDETRQKLREAGFGFQSLFASSSTMSSSAVRDAVDVVAEAVKGARDGAQDLEDALDKFVARLDRDKVRVVKRGMQQAAPEVYDVLITQRDKLLADALLDARRDAPADRPVVGVFGLAHLDGVERLVLSGGSAPRLPGDDDVKATRRLR